LLIYATRGRNKRNRRRNRRTRTMFKIIRKMKKGIINVGTKSKNSLHSDNMDTEAMMVKLRNFAGMPTVKPVENGLAKGPCWLLVRSSV
jgi:hypothetical protein